MNDWIAAAIAAGAGLMLGVLAGRLTQAILGRQGRPDVLRAASRPLENTVSLQVRVVGT